MNPFPSRKEVREDTIQTLKERLIMHIGDYQEKKFLQQRLKDLIGYTPVLEMIVNKFGQLKIQEI